MKEIITKSSNNGIKVLDKPADVFRRAKNAYVRAKKQTEQTQRQDHNSFAEYAEDKVEDRVKTLANETGHTVKHQGKKALQKIKDRRSINADTNYMGAANGYTAARKFTLSKPNELAKWKFIQSRAKQRFSLNREIQVAESKYIQATEAKSVQAVQNSVLKPAEKTVRHTIQPNISGTSRTVKQSARSSGKTIRKTATTMIKTTQKSIKTAGQAAKVGVKTSRRAAKAGTKTIQVAKTAQRSALATREAAKFTVRMLTLTVKVAAVLVKGLVTLMGIGGAVLALFLIVIAGSALVSSPFGIFFSSENKDAEVTPISNVVQMVNAELAARIEDIKSDHDYVDSMDVHSSGSADNIRIDNWIDVVAVFAVKTAMDDESSMDVATIDTTRIDLVKSVFWDMNLIDYYIETIEYTETETVDNGDGTTSEETTTTYEYILHITITSKTAAQQADEYSFTDNQMSIMEEMLSGEYRQMMFTLLGVDEDGA